MLNPYQPTPVGHSNRLKAKGNLGLIQFLQVLQKMWIDAHPDVPLVATGGREVAEYPVIIYRQDLTKPIEGEPKPRYREEIATNPGEPNYIIAGQRFQHIITFTVFTSTDPHLAEAILDAFEDFMLQFTPIFKELGVSEIVYARRLPDGEDTRPGLAVNERSVSYMVTIEKIIKVSVQKLENVLVNARLFLEDPFWSDQATPATPILVNIEDQYSTLPDATPQF